MSIGKGGWIGRSAIVRPPSKSYKGCVGCASDLDSEMVDERSKQRWKTENVESFERRENPQSSFDGTSLDLDILSLDLFQSWEMIREASTSPCRSVSLSDSLLRLFHFSSRIWQLVGLESGTLLMLFFLFFLYSFCVSLIDFIRNLTLASHSLHIGFLQLCFGRLVSLRLVSNPASMTPQQIRLIFLNRRLV